MPSEEPETSMSLFTGDASVFSIIAIQALLPRKRIKGPIPEQNKLLSLACKYLEKLQGNEENLISLLKCVPINLLFAEKSINNVIFEESMNSLQMDSVQINATGNISGQTYVFTGTK